MKSSSNITAVDLFCGAGGLTYGLEKAGIDVRVGVDLDPSCAHAISANTSAEFVCADVARLDPKVIINAFENQSYTLLAGCAPCQPFSTYSRSAKQKHGVGAGDKRSEDWRLVEHFSKLVQTAKPTMITMENVPPLASQPVFKDFIESLHEYWVDWKIVECSTIGLPQTRKRLVLVASKLGPIRVPVFNRPQKTVRDVIGSLPPIEAGGQDENDPMHKASRLSEVNMRRIKASAPGGTWRDWPIELRSSCHVKDTGATYPSVYGRMEWDAPAPTITTQSFGYGNGRFGHPEQNRAISLREAAMLQGFPRDYSFTQSPQSVSFASVGRLIGNAIPVTLATALGEIFVEHVQGVVRDAAIYPSG